MTQEEMKKEFTTLYDMMADSDNVENMRVFGQVHKEMMDWFINNKSELAQEWLDKLESIKWKNYLTPKEADTIVTNMDPKAPWGFDQWKQAMKQNEFALCEDPDYNMYALWAVMNMIISDSGSTLNKYIDGDNMFKVVYDLAVDKLTDKDGVFNIRKYFSL